MPAFGSGSSWNEGVGEHVRTKSQPERAPVKLRSSTEGSALNEENSFLLPDRLLEA
jgi:hypothetical protein